MSTVVREVRQITSRAEWLDWRRGHITASQVAALFDCHPFLSREGLAAELMGASNHGDSPAMRRGRILEPAIIAALGEEKPEWKISRATTYHCMPDLRLGATPDAWLGDDTVLQLKTVSPEQWEKWRGRPPLAYTLQTLTEALVADRARGVLAVMVCSPSYPVTCFDIPRHEAAENRIMAAVAEWWRAWDVGEIAVPAAADGLAEAVDDGSHRDLSGSNELPIVLDERERLKADVSAAEKRLKAIDYDLKNRIGAARTAYVPGWNLTFGSQHRKETILPATDFRVLRVKRVEE